MADAVPGGRAQNISVLVERRGHSIYADGGKASGAYLISAKIGIDGADVGETARRTWNEKLPQLRTFSWRPFDRALAERRATVEYKHVSTGVEDDANAEFRFGEEAFSRKGDVPMLM